MIQRFERITIQDQLINARSQLSEDYKYLQSMNYEELSPPDSAQLLLTMINKLSSPTIGTQILRTDLFHLEYPYLSQYEIVLDRAEMFYYQSIMQDLTRIRANEHVVQISKEQIRQCVQQLNWKINMERASALNQSQQIGQNMDLMKFFEGVRNYQNWYENIKRQTLQQLKQKSHKIENELSFKKGFILSKIQSKVAEIRKQNLSELFKIDRQYVRFEKLMNIFLKYSVNQKKHALELIIMKSKQKTPLQIFNKMFKRYLPKKVSSEVRKMASQYRSKKQKMAKVVLIVSSLRNKVISLLKMVAFKRMNLKPFVKASNFTTAADILKKVSKKICIKLILKALNLPIRNISNIINNIYLRKLEAVFSQLKKNDLQIRLQRPNVSYRVKGKILASLNKYEKQPINLKKVFSKWHLNTHSDNFSKKIYNIWLQGNTNKFTFFMRLKNMVNLLNKNQISKELKQFVKVICDNYSKYQEHNKKHMLSTWIENTRRIRKIQNMYKLLGQITSETQIQFKKTGIDKISLICKRKQIVKNYCNKFMLQFIQNIKLAVNKWRHINNLKKEWGKKKLRMILLDRFEQIVRTQKNSLQILKQYWREGQEKKKIQVRKAINKDQVFLQRMMQAWRHNMGNTKIQNDLISKKTNQNKQKSLKSIEYTFKKVSTQNIREAIKKFISNKSLRIRRQNNLKNNFINLIQKNEKMLKRQIINQLQQNYHIGKAKKQKLVTNLVHANVIKQKMALLIFRNKSSQITQLLKRKKSSIMFDALQTTAKQNYMIFNKQLFTAKVLQKILNNYTENINLAFRSWKALPLRMRWKLRSKIITLHERLTFHMKNRLSFCHNQMKSSVIGGKLKQKKAVYIMACKFEMVIKKYFDIYHKKCHQLKGDNKIKIVSKLFQAANLIQKNNFRALFLSPPEWPKKAAALDKLDGRLKKRFTQYFRAWSKYSQAIKSCNHIKDECKKRYLTNIEKIANNSQKIQIKDVIKKFLQHNKITQIKINLLKKIIDSHAKKMLKGFQFWKKLPNPRNKERIQKASKFQFSLQKLVHLNLTKTLNCLKRCSIQGHQKKMNLVRRLVSGISNRVKDTFSKWKENKNIKIIFTKQNKIQSIFKLLQSIQSTNFGHFMKGLEGQKKRNSIRLIQKFEQNQNRKYLKRWHNNSKSQKIKDVKKKHLLLSLNNIKTKFQNKNIYKPVIEKLLNNKKEEQRQKHRFRVQQVSKMIENYQKHKRLLLNITVDKLKFIHIMGNFYKNRSFSKFLKGKIAQVHKVLDIWNNLSNQAKQAHKQKIVSHNFDETFDIVKKNFYLILGRSKDAIIKKNALDKLFNIQQIKFLSYFRRWQQNIKELKILGEMDRQTKAAILQRINKIAQSTSTQTIIATIKKFHLHFKFKKVQRKFIQKLLQTKGGKVITAFKSWKSIPVTVAKAKYNNYQKFYFRMENFYNNRLKFANNILLQAGDQGNLMKKQSILKLFEMTSLGIRRYYNRWTRLTKEKQILMSVTTALKAFQTAETVISNQYQIMFQDQRAYNIKISAINKLIKAAEGTTFNYFTRWRDNIKQMKIFQSMDKESKKGAIQMFNKAMGNSKAGQLINIITLFQKNAKIVKVARSFFNRLMNTKTGKVMQFLQKMKSIPDAKMNKRKKKAIIFESRLNSFVLKRLRDTFNPFKQNTYTASVKMKYCIERLIRASMGEHKKKFLIWRNINRESKMLAHTSLFEKIFTNAQISYKNNFKLLVKDASSEMQKKKSLCRRLINNSLFVQHHAYMIWKQAYHVDDINNKKRQNFYTIHLKNLIGVFKNHQSKKVINAISVFRKLLEIRNFEEYDFYKKYRNKKCLNFYENIRKLQTFNKSIFINALKMNQSEYKTVERSQKLLNVFQVINHQTKTNMTQLMETGSQTDLLKKVFDKLTNNCMLNMAKILTLWRDNKKEMQHQQNVKNNKKIQMLKQLNHLLIQKKGTQILQALHKFNLNLKVCETKKRVLLKWVKSKSAKIPVSFNTWKNIPYQEAKKLKAKATKFQNGLMNFFKNSLKYVNDCFKQCLYEGVTKKQEAARTIVRSKLIDSNRLFFAWRKANNQNKVKQKILSLDKTMTTMQKIFLTNFSIMDGSKTQDQRKVRASTLLFNNNVKKLNGFFNIWRRNSKIIKMHHFQKLMRLFVPQDFNKRLMKICFAMIVKKNQLQIMKGYINSLWKWKLSNIQASYYTKIIRVFKQNEEIIKLSDIINKKLYQNIHHGFRSILSEGHLRTNRKKEIVQKYLTRKARNYFSIFKNNTLWSQINIWKSKYTESIKAKITSDVLSSILLKKKLLAFKKIQDYYNYTQKIYSLQMTIQKLNRTNKHCAFNKIKNMGSNRILLLCDRLQANLSQDFLHDSFNRIKLIWQSHKFNQITSKIVRKHFYQQGYDRINRKKQRVIKSTLSIILLETLLKNHMSSHIKFYLSQFSKNRFKRVGSEKIFKVLNAKYKVFASCLFEECINIKNITKLLERYKRAQALKRILEKQDEQLKKAFLNRMRKRENKWMSDAVRKFATRAYLRSSPAVALWRMKTYASNN